MGITKMALHITKLTSENVEDIIDRNSFGEPQTDPTYGNVSIRTFVKDDNGQKQPLLLETPWMKAPFGVNKFDPTGPNARPKFKIPLSYHRLEDYERQQVFKRFYELLDEKLVDVAFENAGSWLKREGEPKAVVKAFYSPSMTYSKDKKGKINMNYPPKIQIKLGTYQNDDGSIRFAAPVYKDKDTTLSNPMESIQKGCDVKSIIECTGVWEVNGKFGLGWRANQLKVKEKAARNAYVFEDDSDDESDDENNDENTMHTFEEDDGEKNDESIADVEEEEEEEEEEEKPATPKPKKKAA